MMNENSKEVTGSHEVQDDPATYCAEKDGLEESYDAHAPAPQKLGLCLCYHAQLSRI